MFLIDTKDEIFREAQIPYGHISIEGFEPETVRNRNQAYELLEEGVRNGILSQQQAEVIFEQVTAAGLLENDDKIFDRLVAYPLPEDLTSTFEFVVHTPCDDLHLPHGQVKNPGMGQSSVIYTLHNGLVFLDGMAQNKIIDPLVAIKLFQQMKAADLPLDEEDFLRRNAELPEEKRRSFTVIALGNKNISLLDALLRRTTRRPQPSAG